MPRYRQPQLKPTKMSAPSTRIVRMSMAMMTGLDSSSCHTCSPYVSTSPISTQQYRMAANTNQYQMSMMGSVGANTRSRGNSHRVNEAYSGSSGLASGRQQSLTSRQMRDYLVSVMRGRYLARWLCWANSCLASFMNRRRGEGFFFLAGVSTRIIIYLCLLRLQHSPHCSHSSMPLCTHPLLLALILACVTLAQDQPDCTLTPYYQSLHLQPGSNLVHMQFTLCPAKLPHPLSTLLPPGYYITIQSGPLYHQVAGHNVTYNRISTYIAVPAGMGLLPGLRQVIEGVFSVSVPERYSVDMPEIGSIFVSDPNDKFCRQHVEQILRLLPCGDRMGLAQLIDLEGFFTGRQLRGMRVEWNSGYLRIKVSTEMGRQATGLKRVRIGEKCVGELVMMDREYREMGIKEILVDRLKQQTVVESSKVSSFRVGRQIRGNWYNPQKSIIVSFRTEGLQNNSRIVVRQLVPSRAGITRISVLDHSDNLVPSHKWVVRAHPHEQKYKQDMTAIQVHVQVQNQALQLQPVYFTISIEMENKLMSFDLYESIFGGGAELVNVPVLVLAPTQNHTLFAHSIVLRTPQPDESLPFQVITFVLGIFGYLWLSVWRKFAADYTLSQLQQSVEKGTKLQ